MSPPMTSQDLNPYKFFRANESFPTRGKKGIFFNILGIFHVLAAWRRCRRYFTSRFTRLDERI